MLSDLFFQVGKQAILKSMLGSRKSHLRILTSILSNISAGLLLLPLTISLSSGIVHLDALTISFILAIIYYGFAVRVESILEDI